MSHKIENLIKDIKDGVISYTALEKRLDEELMKPFDEQDFDLIDELNEFIMEFSGNNDVLSDEEIEDNIAEIKRTGIKRSSFTVLPYVKYMAACGRAYADSFKCCVVFTRYEENRFTAIICIFR